MSLLDVLARLGRAAALVTLEGRVVFMNGQAEVLLAGAVQDGRLRAWRRAEQTDLEHILSHAIEKGPATLAEPIAISRPATDAPILVQAIPVGRALAGEPAALILLADPTRPDPVDDPVAALELLGLTRSEARVAALVGQGKSAREAGDILAITENTARSTLQLVYEKLSIGKQSELARIVARLEGFGAPLSQVGALAGNSPRSG